MTFFWTEKAYHTLRAYAARGFCDGATAQEMCRIYKTDEITEEVVSRKRRIFQIQIEARSRRPI